MPSYRRSPRISSGKAAPAAAAPAATASAIGKRTGKKARGRTSTKKIAKMTKKAAKAKIITKMKKTYKVTASTGTNPSQILNAIRETLSDSQFLSASTQESQNIKDLLLPKLYGLKSTKVVREILETPAKPSTVQGPSLYGCGGTGLPVLGSTSSWFFPGTQAEKEAMKNSGLVFCWMTLVACTFKQGGGNFRGRGINHEMEHAMACAGQVIGNLLAQSLNVGEDKHYRKHHVILFEVMKVLLAEKVLSDGRPVTETMIKRYVYLIMRMIRRQQVLMGLPSISAANQKKCQLNLLRMKVDPTTLKTTVETNGTEVNNIMDSVESDDSNGMVLKEGKPVSFSICGWCGVNNAESAFDSEERLAELYSSGYRTTTGQPDQTRIQAAVTSAMNFKNNTDKRGILKKQCKTLCDKYNEMSEAEIVKGEEKEDLSRFIISASIIVLSVIIKATYKELGVETVHMPELFKWVDKAKEILSDEAELERLLGKREDETAAPGARWIITKSQELSDESGNEVTSNYLNFKDATINDFVTRGSLSDAGVQAGGAPPLGGITLDGYPPVTSMFQNKKEVEEPITPVNRIYDPRAGIPGPPQPTTLPQPTTPPPRTQLSQPTTLPQPTEPELDINKLIAEINNNFRYPGTNPSENLGVEENITLMFDYFERMSSDINPDFISEVEENIDDLTDNELIELYKKTFGNTLEITEGSGLMETEESDGESEEDLSSQSITELEQQALQQQALQQQALQQQALQRDMGSNMDMDDLQRDVGSNMDMDDLQRDMRGDMRSDMDMDDLQQQALQRDVGSDTETMDMGGGGKKKSKKKTKRKNIKKSKKRKKNTKRKRMSKKNTKRKSNKKNTKRKSNKKKTKK